MREHRHKIHRERGKKKKKKKCLGFVEAIIRTEETDHKRSAMIVITIEDHFSRGLFFTGVIQENKRRCVSQ